MGALLNELSLKARFLFLIAVSKPGAIGLRQVPQRHSNSSVAQLFLTANGPLLGLDDK